MQICAKCKKPHIEITKECKACKKARKEYDKDYYLKNKVRRLQTNRAWREANKAEYKKKQVQYYRKKREELGLCLSTKDHYLYEQLVKCLFTQRCSQDV